MFGGKAEVWGSAIAPLPQRITAPEWTNYKAHQCRILITYSDHQINFVDRPAYITNPILRTMSIMKINTGGSIEKMQNYVKVVARDHMTILGNFGVPSISRERLKLETSNLARRMIRWFTIVKNGKLGEKGSPECHVAIFGNFGTPSISRERLQLETSNLARR